MAKEFFIKQGEARTLTILLKTRAGNPIDLTNAVCYLMVKETPDSEDFIVKKDTQYFDKTSAANGIVSVTLDDSETWVDPGKYFVELKVIVSGQILKTMEDVYLNIKKSVFDRRFVAVSVSVPATSGITGTATKTP
jgi:hypothetical protein